MNTEPIKDYLANLEEPINFGYELASPMERLAAVIIEAVIIYLPLYFILGNGSIFFSDQYFDVKAELLQTGFSCALGAIFYSMWSGNLGHKIMGLKVISSIDGVDKKIASVGMLREGLKGILGLVLIPSIWLLWDARRQNLYDKILNTLVVKKQD